MYIGCDGLTIVCLFSNSAGKNSDSSPQELLNSTNFFVGWDRILYPLQADRILKKLLDNCMTLEKQCKIATSLVHSRQNLKQ